MIQQCPAGEEGGKDERTGGGGRGGQTLATWPPSNLNISSTLFAFSSPAFLVMSFCISTLSNCLSRGEESESRGGGEGKGGVIFYNFKIKIDSRQ